MTEQTHREQDQDVDEQTTPAEGEQTPDETPEESSKANREAARYRRQLRDTETERDALAARITAMETGRVMEAAAQQLSQPGDALEYANLDEYRNDDGDITTASIEAGLAALVKARPGLAKPRPLRRAAPPGKTFTGRGEDPGFAAGFKSRHKRIRDYHNQD
ncbi:hypothetical protein [Actinomadura algeriensis]|uniref:Uncharacterized protein n=1 Tax=Actinomadura algeriensis TaxID=1679523 RepID=A0ABR9JKR6_9ACTN|nr:hypothetical protein [Actinomadura algeriensis]MBE1531146.1 hypothetical protein [Actinomadura algeriensis]